MSRKILKQIFDNNTERLEISDSQFHEDSNKLDGAKEKFVQSLSESEKKLYDDICDLEGRVNAVSEFEHFAEGFRLGVALVADILYRK
ncbi:MAG: hypothetical protein FWH07_06745 [Oscillospiraceae bacterium]|nr:hypothetical protein [Oscillospiraceae bacterium]